VSAGAAGAASGRGSGGPRCAVIDIGGNSVLLLTVAVGRDGRARAVDEARATTRLGAGLADGGTLDAAARARTREAVVAFAARARAAGATRVWAFATAALRRAADGPAWAHEIAVASGTPVEVLPGECEARLAYAGVARAMGSAGPLLVADVGGGTTELALGRDEEILGTASLPLGALALTEAYLHADPPSAAELSSLTAAADVALASTPLPACARAAGARLAVSGGTATALAALDLGLTVYEPRRVHAHSLGRAALGALAARLAAMPAAARAALPGVDPGRAAILPAGALVLERVAVAAGAAVLAVSDHGVRHAYLRARLAALGVDADLRELWR